MASGQVANHNSFPIEGAATGGAGGRRRARSRAAGDGQGPGPQERSVPSTGFAGV